MPSRKREAPQAGGWSDRGSDIWKRKVPLLLLSKIHVYKVRRTNASARVGVGLDFTLSFLAGKGKGISVWIKAAIDQLSAERNNNRVCMMLALLARLEKGPSLENCSTSPPGN